jgi:tetratricopeptide (TPR) repeat protein
MLAQVTAQSQAWARSQLAAIRGLTAANNLTAARELLQQLIVAAPATMQPAITQLEAEIAQAELMNKEPLPPGAATPLASPWDAALALFEQQKYDEAIAGFQMLLTSEHGADAKVKIAEASELAAAALRRQAAALYAKAKKTIDPTAKQQGMLHSRALLLDLIEKYPASSVVDKARQNLKTLDGELGPATTTPAPPPATGVPPEMDRH